MYYIYLITNQVNGKNYIGQRKCPKNKFPETDTKYMGSGLNINRAFEKYGMQNFSKSILAVAHTKENIDILEKVFIALYRAEGKVEYNIADGGTGGNLGEECNKRISLSLKGHIVSEESKKKNSVSHKGRTSPNKGKKTSEETKRKQSMAHKRKAGHPVSEEVRKKISATLKGHPVSEEVRKKISEKTKMAMNKDVCQKISEKNKERFQKLEQRKKLSDAHKGKKLSEEHKRHISESLRRKYNEL